MKHPMVKITPSESILAQSKFKEKALERIFNFISTNYKRVNAYFGIEQNVSDQIWFYGFYGLAIIILLYICMIVGSFYSI
ncbi:DUF3961 domain-containing protein [Bacillus cereus group sp. Bc222]|uniref:DUF3961 domain-containing protein n=1 Tax=Bacillus cereus group TaxID=86661 RepID=UPI0015D4E11C|nr:MULTISPECIES: DUF3961 domain-containing protein [Bacillus cereus group]MCU4862696.1 DUF3961 domain-containing protein [Bacillus cereus]MCU5031849.1 DUF3961 domain-containing protein [Bacillus cereus]MCU5769652.1 DUF3961 domain-containing protein [Bacillus cereus]MDA2241486.1 DUF3961 domain-containing protein [Bacillus cereus group sp. Bc222]MDH2866268.1 DUF3961 domain-containing protein [Bacillus cytotoxicus]